VDGMTTDEHFYTWWVTIGNGIAVLRNHDHKEHAQRVAHFAWIDSRGQAFREDLTTKDEYFRRLGDLLAVTEIMIKERDEARQLCCRMSAQFVYLSNELCTAKFVANEKGWDCFEGGKTDGK
jgi:hypothetical protein